MAKRRRPRWLDALILALAPRVISAVIALLGRTARIEFIGEDELFARWRDGQPSLIAFWHDRLLMMPVAYRGPGMRILLSPSQDGEIASRALDRWGIGSVRGSASRGGARGFLALVHAFRKGADLGLVPDGPRGPRRVAKPGVVHVARATGALLFPVSYAASHGRFLRSWDRLFVPRPFARVCFVIGTPMTVPRDADDGAIEDYRVELERRLTAATRAAEERVGAVPS